jgi:hypothetical protein
MLPAMGHLPLPHKQLIHHFGGRWPIVRPHETSGSPGWLVVICNLFSPRHHAEDSTGMRTTSESDVLGPDDASTSPHGVLCTLPTAAPEGSSFSMHSEWSRGQFWVLPEHRCRRGLLYCAVHGGVGGHRGDERVHGW